MAADKSRFPRNGSAGSPAGPGERPWYPARPIGLARALLKSGYATRRQADELVRAGRVRIGSAVVTDPRQTVEAGASIYLDGAHLQRLEFRYFAIHKPLRVVCDETDGPGKRRLVDLFPPNVPGLAAAGRLDSKTSGLMLVSNDTVWNNMITTTEGLEQEFRVQVEGEVSDIEISVMDAGVHLPGLGLIRPQHVRVVERMNSRTVVNMSLREGKVRQLRKMLETMRHKVTLVRRVRIGDIRLGDLQVGAVRELSSPEVAAIRDFHGTAKRKASVRGRPGSG